MRKKLIILAATLLIAAASITAQDKSETESSSSVPVGGWDVTFSLLSPTTVTNTRRLMFMSFSDGTGTFRIIGPRTTWTTQTIFPSVWRSLTPSFMSFSGEVEFPIGNCCREAGTLVFKGTRANDGTMSGPVLFITSNPIVATPAPYTIRTGTFVATPLPIIAVR